MLSCPLCCHSNFHSVESLRISLIKVTNRPLICPICNEILLGLDKLTIHLFSHSIGSESDVVVIEKSRKTTTESLKSVRKIKNSKSTVDESSIVNKPLVTEVNCDMCTVGFKNETVLAMHTNLLHSNKNLNTEEPPKFQCHLCSKYFKMKGSLKVHLRVVHLGFINKKNEDKKIKSSPTATITSVLKNSVTVKNISELLNAPATKINDDEKFLLINKIENVNSSVCSDNRNSCSENNKLTTISTGGDSVKIWECDTCAKSFTTKYFLKKHKRLHTGEMPYSCGICGKTFTFQQSYHKHLLYHSDDKPHICSTCNRAFKELSTLHNHERIHSGEKPFKCETCDKCFRQRVSYLVHKRIHTGAMPYKCTACDKSFRYKVSQRTHKCPAQPPGMVVRQTGDLLQKLLQNSSQNNLLIPEEELEQKQTISLPDEISLDDLLQESCKKMGIDNSGNFHPTELNENNQPSPIQFQNLCLYSPEDEFTF